jgi:hypothetical protein
MILGRGRSVGFMLLRRVLGLLGIGPAPVGDSTHSREHRQSAQQLIQRIRRGCGVARYARHPAPARADGHASGQPGQSGDPVGSDRLTR